MNFVFMTSCMVVVGQLLLTTASASVRASVVRIKCSPHPDVLDATEQLPFLAQAPHPQTPAWKKTCPLFDLFSSDFNFVKFINSTQFSYKIIIAFRDCFKLVYGFLFTKFNNLLRQKNWVSDTAKTKRHFQKNHLIRTLNRNIINYDFSDDWSRWISQNFILRIWSVSPAFNKLWNSSYAFQNAANLYT